ncbi:unnamed protein product [Blepharisma stoltei]|uniref:Kelch motif family protein n=1 Tax=Blepharisma stoltei TaxID=1481888 RepID=A0AAU9IPC0_9CILI|nr:unnamed protein product [Blepharisma stoltei]
MSNCVLCQEQAKKICYCSGVALCENHFQAHLEVLTEIDHYSEEISQANQDMERIKQLKLEITNFVILEMQRLDKITDDCFKDLAKTCDSLIKTLNEVKIKIQAETQQANASLRELVENIDTLNLEQLYQKMQSQNSEFFSIEWNSPWPGIQEIINKSQHFSIDWYRPDLNYYLYNGRKNKIKSYDIRSKKISVSNINNFECKVAPHILPIEDGLFVTGGANILGLTTDEAWFINLKAGNAEQKAKMRYKRYYHSAVYFNKSIFVIGGINERRESEAPFEIEKYDLKTNIWENIGPLQFQRRSPGACIYKNFIFVAGCDNSKTIEKIHLDTYYNESVSIREKIGEGCTLVPTPSGIVVFSLSKIFLIDENCQTLQEVRISEQTSWWCQCPPVRYGEFIYLVRFGNYHLIKFNLSKFSIEAADEEIPFDSVK